MSDRPHGTYARYKLDGCRCYPCAAAASTYNTQRERAIAYGRWTPYVDAAPVREHIRTLQGCGVGLRTIAAAAGVDRKRLQAILNGRPGRGTPPQPKVRPATAAAILAVEPALDLLPAKTVIDGGGTRRRLQALVTLGWSQAKLADRLGWTPTNLGTLLRGDRTTAATARKVRALYDELWNQAPPEATHREKIAASRARNHAQKLGWAPPLAWDDDDIDDPSAVPNVGAKASRREALAENAEELISRFGCTPEVAAERLGIQVGYMQTLRRQASRRREALERAS
jgi:transcriptional regulator with XRE-family HTH domain